MGALQMLQMLKIRSVSHLVMYYLWLVVDDILSQKY